MQENLFRNIESYIDSFGSYYKKKTSLFKKLIGNRLIDILLHMPSYSIEKLYCNNISKEDIGKIITIQLKIECIETSNSSRFPSKVYLRSKDESLIEILLFNYKKDYLKSSFPIGSNIIISGKLNISNSGVLQFINPKKVKSISSGIFNIYPLTSGIFQENIYSIMKNALNILKNIDIKEWIPQDILIKNKFKSFYDSLYEIHNPKDIDENKINNIARKRIMFDELLAEQISIRLSSNNFINKSNKGKSIKNEKRLVSKLLEILPFSLTSSQNKAISEIFKDLESDDKKPMTRLLQGDVGSGKTIVSIISALYCIESGYQCAILAPTEILAIQHYKTFKFYLDKLNINNVDLLTSNTKLSKRKEILDNIYNGTSSILIGTHAIITDQVKFKNLGLVIVDEQHRFGVKQRLDLIEKGESPHVLSMTATPIPRTIIMSLYGDIDVSSISQKPIGRKEIITKVININKIQDVIKGIDNIISNNQKVYWVCPLIEESLKTDYTCVINRFEFLKKYFENNVEMLHGKMKSSEKEEIFKRFTEGDTHILVSTTVIEVGVDVSNASVIIIENAEKFGLAQLHQLRGRVGRSNIQSYCILLYDQNHYSKIAKERLDIMRETNDGFLIAEKDLKLRGGGEILGTKQSGLKNYRTFDRNDPDIQDEIYNILKEISKTIPKIIENNKFDEYNTLLKIFSHQDFISIKKSF